MAFLLSKTQFVRLLSTAAATATKTPYKNQILSNELVSQYHRDGFLLMEDFLTPKEKKDLIEWTNEIQNWPETKGKHFTYYENINGKKTLCRTENFLPYHEGIRSLIHGKLSKAMSDLFQEEAVIFKEKINYKLPGAGGFPPHQDAPAYVAFNQKLHMTMMLAVDPMTPENGCLDVVRGEHSQKTIEQNPDGSIKDEIVKKMKWEPVLSNAGAVMAFNSYIPHRSGPNITSGPRRAYYLTFNALSEGSMRDGYYAQKKELFPPEIDRDPTKDYSEGAKIYNLATPIK